MKKTRKVKNKKLFLKWLKRSSKNDYSIKHGGQVGDDKTDDKSALDLVESHQFVSTRTAVALTAAATLGEIAYSLASNPVVVGAIVGLGIGSAAFTGIVSGGATVVIIAVMVYANAKIREAYSNYHTMLYVMDDYILLLQKIDNLVRLAIKISQQYNFVIDTKDVNKALERIFIKFDKLLSVDQIKEIKEDIKVKGATRESTSKLLETAVATAKKNSEQNRSDDDIEREDPETIKLIVRGDTEEPDKKKSPSRWESFIQGWRTVTFKSEKWSTELNEEVARVGLYFSILLGEFNITLNVCEMRIIGNQELQTIADNNNKVKDSEEFNKLLVSSLIYRSLQIYNLFKICNSSKNLSKSVKKSICGKDFSKEESLIVELEKERANIRMVLFGTKYNNVLFPLYLDDDIEDDTGLKKLRDVMRAFPDAIKTKEQATKFVDALYAFNQEYAVSKQTVRDTSRDFSSTKHITDKDPGYKAVESDAELKSMVDRQRKPMQTRERF
jgi:hypothetical protein